MIAAVAAVPNDKSAVGKCDDTQPREVELRMEIGIVVAADPRSLGVARVLAQDLCPNKPMGVVDADPNSFCSEGRLWAGASRTTGHLRRCLL